MLYPIFRQFLADIVIPTGKLLQECRSLLNLFSVLDHLRCLTSRLITGVELHRLIVQHLDSYKSAYGDEAIIKPKTHFSMHLGSYLSSQQLVLSCFVHERKHRFIKKWASDTLNTKGYEKSIILDLLNQQLEALQDPTQEGCFLVKEASLDDPELLSQIKMNFPGVQRCFISREAGCHGVHCCLGDVVFVEDAGKQIAGKNYGHIRFDPCPMGLRSSQVVILQLWHELPMDHWRPQAALAFAPLESVLEVAAWSE